MVTAPARQLSNVIVRDTSADLSSLPDFNMGEAATSELLKARLGVALIETSKPQLVPFVYFDSKGEPRLPNFRERFVAWNISRKFNDDTIQALMNYLDDGSTSNSNLEKMHKPPKEFLGQGINVQAMLEYAFPHMDSMSQRLMAKNVLENILGARRVWSKEDGGIVSTLTLNGIEMKDLYRRGSKGVEVTCISVPKEE